jgi:hypothetical protein
MRERGALGGQGANMHHTLCFDSGRQNNTRLESEQMNSVDKVVDECLGGFAYGVTSVIVAQPFDTVKTRMQMSAQASATGIARELFKVRVTMCAHALASEIRVLCMNMHTILTYLLSILVHCI